MPLGFPLRFSRWNAVWVHAAMLGFAGCVAVSSPAFATQGGLFGGPIGGSDMRSAYLPPPDEFFVAPIVFGQHATNSVNATGDNGKAHVNDTYIQLGGSLLYTYPVTLAGGVFASSITLSDKLIDGEIGTKKNAAHGFNDIYVDFLRWSKYVGLAGAQPGEKKLPYGLTINTAFSSVVPTTSYNPHRVIALSRNDWVLIPNIAVSYLTGPNLSFGDGTEISARAYYDFSTQNDFTKYRDGDVFVLDFAVTERFSNLQAGLAGTLARQTTADRQNGVAFQNGNRLFALELGPVVAYDVPEWHASFKAKTLFTVAAQNRINPPFIGILSAAFRIF
jgi:hypothetical protein